MSRADHSCFLWDNDSKPKLIEHPPTCKIPLMPVNENRDNVQAFFNKCTNVIDNSPLLPNGILPNTFTIQEQEEPQDGGNTDPDQQPGDVPSSNTEVRTHLEGSTVRSIIDGNPRISIVTKAFRTTVGHKRYKIRHLNEQSEHVVTSPELKTILPEPADIPIAQKEVDRKLVEEELSKDDLNRLWNGELDSTVKEADRITLYWHHRLRHAPLVFLRRLSARGVLPACIQKVFRMPLCAACAFAQAHRRNWRTP